MTVLSCARGSCHMTHYCTALQVAALIATVDEDGTGEIGFEEFLQVVTRQEPGKENPLAKLYRALAAGELGDPILHLSVLIAAYRYEH